jgi:hypothetical protein
MSREVTEERREVDCLRASLSEQDFECGEIAPAVKERQWIG